MQLVSKFDLMNVEFGKWNKSTVTSLDFKNHLINVYPDYRWTQKDCSDFLANQGLTYRVTTNKDNQQYRVYNVNPSTNLYYSESRGEFLEIDEMNIVHLENAINKSFGDLTIAEFLDEVDSQEWYMLRTFLNKKTNEVAKTSVLDDCMGFSNECIVNDPEKGTDSEDSEQAQSVKVYDNGIIITNISGSDIPKELENFLLKVLSAK